MVYVHDLMVIVVVVYVLVVNLHNYTPRTRALMTLVAYKHSLVTTTCEQTKVR